MKVKSRNIERCTKMIIKVRIVWFFILVCERCFEVRRLCVGRVYNKWHFVSIREVVRSECFVKEEVTRLVLVYLHVNINIRVKCSIETWSRGHLYTTQFMSIWTFSRFNIVMSCLCYYIATLNYYRVMHTWFYIFIKSNKLYYFGFQVEWKLELGYFLHKLCHHSYFDKWMN